MSGAVFSAVLSPGNRVLGRGTLANRPTASAFLYDREYITTNEGEGDITYWCDGTSWRAKGPATTHNDPSASTWALRGSGVSVGDIKRITDLGNNPLVEAMWDGTYWQPRGGEQCIYRLSVPISGSSAATSTATGVTVTIPAGLMNINCTIERLVEVYTNQTPVLATPAMDWDGGALFDAASIGTKKNNRWHRQIRNIGVANSQVITEGNAASDLGGFTGGSTAIQTASKDTTAARTIGSSFVATHATALIATIHRDEVWWRI